ncbi:MAG: type VI secretion system Vgr family protein [Thiohalomonadales bacterium]
MAKLVGDVKFFSFDVTDQDSRLEVEGFNGSEEMSSLYEYVIDLVCDDVNFDHGALLGNSATLTLHDELNKNDRYVNGIVLEVECRGQDDRYLYIRVKLCPLIKLLSHKSDSRIFQNLTVKDIISAVLNAAKLPLLQFSFLLESHYEEKEYCVQYQETDLAFITRLMAEEGLFFFFEHQTTAHQLLIADNLAAYQDISKSYSITYNPAHGLDIQSEAINQLTIASRVKSGKLVISDYNFLNPSLNLSTEKNEQRDADLAQFDYPGNYKSIREGKDLVKRRVEALQAYNTILSGKSDSRRLQVGYRFILKEHPQRELNQEYLIIAVNHFAKQPQVKRQHAFSEKGSYFNKIICIPSETLVRPEFNYSLRPTMSGIQTATVVGPEGEEIFTDDYGRVKVQFHWDRRGKNNESSSCWLRVSQSWAGNGWGAFFVPRISQEVIVNFVDGNPDRPVITGCLYNVNNMPPLNLPKNKSVSGIKCETLRQGKGSNQLLMDDKFGATRVELSNAYGHSIVQDEKNQTTTIQTRDEHSLCMDDLGGVISLKTTNNHSLRMQDADEKSAGEIELKSSSGHLLQLDDVNGKITLESSAGHKIVLDDKSGRVSISTSDGHHFTMDDKEKNIAMVSQHGHSLVLDDELDKIVMTDSGQEHQFSIDIAKQTIVISTTSGSIDLSAPAGEIALKAQDLNIDVSNDIIIKAGKNVKTQAGLALNASATMVTTESSAAHIIKGMPVQLN